PRRLPLEAQPQLRRRRLPAARLAHEAERRSRLERERDAVDRAHPLGAPAEETAPDRKVLAEGGGLEHSAHAGGAPAAGAAIPGVSSQQRVTCPASTTVSGGASTRQRSITDGQRGANAHPAGRRARSGGWPSMAVSRPVRRPRRGMDSSSARL